jgi:hypothetical protein
MAGEAGAREAKSFELLEVELQIVPVPEVGRESLADEAEAEHVDGRTVEEEIPSGDSDAPEAGSFDKGVGESPVGVEERGRRVVEPRRLVRPLLDAASKRELEDELRRSPCGEGQRLASFVESLRARFRRDLELYEAGEAGRGAVAQLHFETRAMRRQVVAQGQPLDVDLPSFVEEDALPYAARQGALLAGLGIAYLALDAVLANRRPRGVDYYGKFDFTS